MLLFGGSLFILLLNYRESVLSMMLGDLRSGVPKGRKYNLVVKIKGCRSCIPSLSLRILQYPEVIK